MRRLLSSLILALLLPASAKAAVRVSAFYYPWYGTSARDGGVPALVAARAHAAERHRVGVLPGARALLVLRPARDRAQQMDEIRAAGIDEIAVSWWGRGSAGGHPPAGGRRRSARRRDQRRGAPRAVRGPNRREHGRRPARTCAATGSARSTSIARSTCRSPTGRRRRRRCTRTARRSSRRRRSSARPRRQASTASTPTTSSSTAATSSRGSASEAHAAAPALRSVGRARATTRAAAAATRVVKPRRNGATYDSMWRAAIAAQAPTA